MTTKMTSWLSRNTGKQLNKNSKTVKRVGSNLLSALYIFLIEPRAF